MMKTTQDSYTITINQIVRIKEMMHPGQNRLNQFQNGHLLAIIDFACPIFGNPCSMASPLLQNKI